MFEKLEKVLMPLAEAIGNNKVLVSIRDGFLIITPLLIAGSIFLVIANLPIPGFSEWCASITIGNGTLATYLSKPTDATFSVMAIFATFGIAYSYAKQVKSDPLFCAAAALMAWFLIMPYVVTGSAKVGGEAVDVALSGIPLGWVGAKGIFVGIFCSFGATIIYTWVKNRGWVIKMPVGVPPTVTESFSSLIPITVTMTLFFVINLVFGMFGTNVFDVVFVFLQTPLLGLGDTLGAMVVAYLFLHAFWFFGINGGSVVGAVFNPILQTLSAENLEFFRTGVGEGHIICQQFQDLFATFGGCGSTLSLLIAMILFCKSARIKQLSRLALIPGVFNINEPIVFGLPIVMNPIIVIPFVLVPTLNIIISYFAMSWGMVPICSGVQIPWTMPLGISGLLATNWAGGVLQIILLAMGVFIYLPFIKVIDNQYLRDEQLAAEDALKAPDEDDVDLDSLSFDDL
ncbi:MAG: PTS sugar transporter subunit IIC [Tractidigestivibacter sp.]|uniref:PTS sugar transporter subunit IIC n=1 Tax=Tractidigestivibacter sp. TaxID=2847320 RepID=UPI002A83022E|nr:PTS sugar transporter subunit IIC [Tractidigestivibacter sp.]MCI6273706.1 PTS sugar transporter subunit IIC [Coriobacteriaceae bacterium]MDD7584619.1 PTS sugar transporter subunit IIC [Coriobacteriaceae bacterium]MDY4534481.1 PTS sugar transporter subunit IIC [Tractidigestivibacter sp.]